MSPSINQPIFVLTSLPCLHLLEQIIVMVVAATVIRSTEVFQLILFHQLFPHFSRHSLASFEFPHKATLARKLNYPINYSIPLEIGS